MSATMHPLCQESSCHGSCKRGATKALSDLMEEQGGLLLWAKWWQGREIRDRSCPSILHDPPKGAWTASMILEKRPKRMGVHGFQKTAQIWAWTGFGSWQPSAWRGVAQVETRAPSSNRWPEGEAGKGSSLA